MRLEGRWKFFWKKFFPPNFQLIDSQKEELKLSVPGLWSQFSNLTPSGFGTYILHLKGLKTNKVLGIYLNGITTSFKAFFVDENKSTLIASVGKVGETKPLTIPRFEVVTAQFTPTSQRGYLVIQVSSFHYKSGGLYYSMGLDSFESIQKKEKFHALRDFFVFGVLLIMALYHFGLFLQRREDVGSLYFGLFTLFLFLRLVGVNNYLMIFFEKPSLFSFELERKIEFISVFMAPPSSMVFQNPLPNFFTLEAQNWNDWWWSFHFNRLAPAKFYSNPLVIQSYQALTGIYLLYMTSKCIQAAIINAGHSRIFLLGTLLLVSGFIHDVLVNEKFLEPPYIISYVLCFFVLIQSYLLSLKFSEATTPPKRLKKDLWKEVQSQMGEISKQNQDLTNLLENLEEGFMVINKEGIVQEGASKVTQSFFNMKTENCAIQHYFRTLPHRERTLHQMVFSYLGRENALKTLLGSPSFYDKQENQFIKLDYRPIYSKKNKVDKLICIASDITKVRELELKANSERDQSKMMLLFLIDLFTF